MAKRKKYKGELRIHKTTIEMDRSTKKQIKIIKTELEHKTSGETIQHLINHYHKTRPKDE